MGSFCDCCFATIVVCYILCDSSTQSSFPPQTYVNAFTHRFARFLGQLQTMHM